MVLHGRTYASCPGPTMSPLEKTYGMMTEPASAAAPVAALTNWPAVEYEVVVFRATTALHPSAQVQGGMSIFCPASGVLGEAPAQPIQGFVVIFAQLLAISISLYL